MRMSLEAGLLLRMMSLHERQSLLGAGRGNVGVVRWKFDLIWRYW
jgi:hypothetical protein